MRFNYSVYSNNCITITFKFIKCVKNTQCMMIKRKMRGIRALGDKSTKMRL